MKKKLIAISILASFLVVVVHDIIPHHHHDEDDIGLISHNHHSEKQDSDTGTDSDNNFRFPAHQHILSAETFDIARTSPNVEINANLLVCCCYANSDMQSYLDKSEPPGIPLYLSFSVPVSSYPFIISPNAMRGSPLMS